MGIHKKCFIGILTVLFIIVSSSSIFYGYEQRNIIEEILKSVEVSIKEYKAVGSFYTTKSKDEIYEDVLEKLISVSGQGEINSEDKYKFQINNSDNKWLGEILILPYKDEYKVTLSISIYGENLDIDERRKLETKVRNVLSIYGSDVEYSLCLKSEITNNTMDEVKEVIINNLSLFKSKNTDEVKINNGYSIIGNTGRYNKRAILGKDIDFNCAIVKYSSGCYLIMGEPEITISY